jgi:hypothetical protein
MNKNIILSTIAVLGLGLGTQAFGESLSTRDGTTYDNITKKRVDVDGIYLEYSPASGGMGVAKVKFARLTKEQQKQFGYDSANAAEYEEQYAAGMAQWRAEQAQRDKAVRQARDLAYEREVASAQEQAIKNEQMLAVAADQNEPHLSPNNGSYYVGGFGVSLIPNVMPQIHHVPPPVFQHIPIAQPFIGTAASGHSK